MSILGLDAALYVNTVPGSTPNWLLVPMIRDVTLNLDKATADTSTRANLGWRTQRGTLKNSVVDFNLVYDVADPSFDVLRDYFLSNQVTDYMVLDGDKDVNGTQGLLAHMDILNFSENQPLEDVITFDVSLGAADYVDEPPQWVEIVGGVPTPVAASVAEMARAGKLSERMKEMVAKADLAKKQAARG